MTLRDFLAIVEIRTKIVSVSTLLLSTIYIALAHGTLSPLKLILMIIATLAVDMGTTAFNTYYDFTRGVDHKETNREVDKVLIHKGVNKWAAFWTAWGLFLLAGILGLILTALTGWPLLIAGGGSMIVGFLYTGGPKPISSTPFGEFFAGGALGAGLFLIHIYLHQETITLYDALISLPSSLMIGAILSVNNACDIQGDTKAGRKTLAILLGPKVAPYVIDAQVIAAYLISIILMVPQEPLTLIPLTLGLILTLGKLAALHRRGFSHHTKMPSMGGISQIFTLFTIVYMGALIIRFW